MKSLKTLLLAGAVTLVAALGASTAQAGYGRQWYTGWQHSGQGYSFSTYYYKPYVGYPTYCYNYALWYPATPSYVYYYNPYRGTYWGRFDIKTKGYSLLAEKDRAGRLKDIPEKAFPAEGALPPVPESKDKVQLEEPPDLPAGEKLDAGTATATAATTGTDTATADKADDLPATPGDPLADTPADQKTDKPAADAPATPADKTQTADKTPPANGQAADGKPGVGVVPQTEPVTPLAATTPTTGATPAGGAAPAGGPAPATGGTATPASGGATGGPVQVTPTGFPFFTGCHSHCH